MNCADAFEQSEFEKKYTRKTLFITKRKTNEKSSESCSIFQSTFLNTRLRFLSAHRKISKTNSEIYSFFKRKKKRERKMRIERKASTKKKQPNNKLNKFSQLFHSLCSLEIRSGNNFCRILFHVLSPF